MPRATPRQRDGALATHPAQQSRSNTTPAASFSVQLPDQHAPLSNDHLYGIIMWLPREDDVLTISQHPYVNTTRELCGLESGKYNHPVLILSPVHQSSFISIANLINGAALDEYQAVRVKILIITSFKETDLLNKYPSPSQVERRRTYLPISPADRHPDLTNMPVLELVGGLQMRKKSYVNTAQTHDVPFQALRPYRRNSSGTGAADDLLSGAKYLLTRESYLLVAKQAGYSIPTIPVSASIPLALPSPPPSPSTPRRATRQFSPLPSTAAQGFGLANSTRGMLTSSPATRVRPPSTPFRNLEAEGFRPGALNPGRGTRVAAARTEVDPLLPTHVYHSDARARGRSNIPSRRPRDVYQSAGGAPSHPQTRDGLIAGCIMLGFLAGAGGGFWAAWVYRAAIGRGLLVSGQWILQKGWELIKGAVKLGWKVLISIAKWVGGVVNGAAGWAWDRLRGVLG